MITKTINCLQCDKEMTIYTYLIEKKGKKYCSRHCYGLSMAGRPGIFLGHKHTLESKQKMSKASKGRVGPMKGHKHTPESIAKISRSKKGQNAGDQHYEWKGQDVGYNALHKWVVKILGKPDTCSYCEKSGLSGHQIHWANISKTYLREADDWIRLCAKCHKNFDTNKLILAKMGG